MPEYNTEIDRRRISVEDPEGSYRYLLNEANVDPEKAYGVYTALQREYAINKPIIDMKNRMFENNPEYKNQLLIKGALDSGTEINEELGIDFNNPKVKSLLKEYDREIDDVFGKDDNLVYSTDHEKVYKTLLNNIKDDNEGLFEVLKYGKDKNGRYYIGLNKDDRRFIKQFFNHCDAPITGFDKTKGFYSRMVKDGDDENAFNNGYVRNDRSNPSKTFLQSAFFTLMGQPHKSISSNQFNRFYEKLNNFISNNTDAGEKEIYSEMYNMGGQNPYQTGIYAMRQFASSKKDLDYYKGLIDADEDKYNALFQTAPNLMETDIKIYDENKNIYETPTDAAKLELLQYLQTYIKKGKKVSINTIYDSFNGKFTPEISFTMDNGLTGKEKVEKTFKFTGDFIHNDSYDEYNKKSRFAAQADVRQMEDIGNQINVGFYRNPNDNTMTNIQLAYAGVNSNGRVYQILINGEPLPNGIISFDSASILRQDYNDLLKVYNELETNKSLTDDYKTATINKCIKDVSNDYRYIFSSLYGETPIVPSGYESLVRTILNR